MKKLISTLLIAACMSVAFGDYTSLITDEARVTGASTVHNTTTSVFVAEGTNAGTNEQYSIAEFTAANFGIVGTVTSLNSVTLDLLDGANSFSASGGYSLYIDTDTTTNLGSYVYATGNPPSGFGSDISGNLMNVGTFTYTSNASGTVNLPVNDTLTLNSAAKTYLINQLNGGGKIRIVLGANDAAVATTFEGIGDTTPPKSGPVLDVNAVVTPEPASVALLGLGALAMFRRRKAS